MQKVVEKIILALVAVSVFLAIIGMVTSDATVTHVGLVVLMVAAAAYAAIQVIMYWKNDDPAYSKSLMKMAIGSVVVTLIIVVVGILLITGKLFPNGFFAEAVDTVKFLMF